jgi:hypothetical protein
MLYNGIPSARVRDHCETITVVNRASAAQDVADPCGDAKQRCSWRKSLSVTREVLGYWRARSTERYAHLADDPIRAAADTLRDPLSLRPISRASPVQPPGVTPSQEPGTSQ